MLYYCYKNISDVSDEQLNQMKDKIRCHFDETASMKRKDSVCAKALLCKMLESISDLKEYVITADKNGKLYIPEGEAYFNISHSKDMIFCVVGSKEIGCDVEQIRECNLKVAKRFFTDDEHGFILKSKSADTDFFRLWTVKESILKHSGDGLSGGLASYDFSDCLSENQFNRYGLNFKTFIYDKYAFAFCSDEKESCLYNCESGGD